MHWLLSLVATALLQATSPATSGLSVANLVVAPPIRVATLDMKQMKGEPRRLAWAPNELSVYIQTVDGRGPTAQRHHYEVTLADGAVATLDEEPDWAVEYWATKVAESAPGLEALRIDVRVDAQKTRVAPFVGAFVTSPPTGTEAASTVTFETVTLRFADTEIGQWVTDEDRTGLTFGWGPLNTGTLAYVDRAGGLSLLDQSGARRAVGGTKNLMLPAWSPTGGYLTALQRSSRGRYELVSVALVRPGRLGLQ